MNFAAKVLIVSLPFVFQFACSGSKGNSRPNKAAVAVTVGKVVVKDMPVQVSAIGEVQPTSSVAVKSQVTGKLLAVNFKEGDVVAKGDLLFTIDPGPFVQALKEAEASLLQSKAAYKVAQANLQSAEAQLSAAKANVLNQKAGVSSATGNLNSLKALSDDALSYLNTQQTLFDQGVIAKRDLEVAQTSYKSALARYQQAQAQVNQAQVIAGSASDSGIAQANALISQTRSQIQVASAQITRNQAAVDNAKIQLGYTRITSPISGKTGALNFTAGNLISANSDTPLVTVNSLSPIYGTFSVAEKYLPEIQKYYPTGEIRVTAQIDPDISRTGILDSLNNQVDTSTGTLQLKAKFENGDGLLYPGRFINIVMNVNYQKGAVVVPAVAVQTSQQGQFVYVVKADNTVEMRMIKLDRTIGDEAVISEGLKEGETVVTDGQLRLGPGASVEIVTGQATGSEAQNSAAGGGQ